MKHPLQGLEESTISENQLVSHVILTSFGLLYPNLESTCLLITESVFQAFDQYLFPSKTWNLPLGTI